MEIIPVVAPNPIPAPKAPVSDSGIFDPYAWEYAWFRHLDIKLDSLTTLVNQVLFLLSKSSGMTKEDVKTIVTTLDGIRKSLQAVSPLPPPKENAMAQQPQKQVPTELQAGLDALKAEASKAAQTITDLKAQINTQMTQADVDNVKSQIDAIASGLKSVNS